MNSAIDTAADPALQRLVDQVRAAHSDARPLAIRGGGTKDFYGGAGTGEPLETGALRGISSYEPTEMVITARAGTPLREIEDVLQQRGQHLAFEPPRFGAAGGQATLGGMVAAGLAGPARSSAGGVRDFVLGACVLTGRGELLRFGGQVMKNVAGYDVSRLFVGSMGVLGVICEVSLKVPPIAAARTTVEVPCNQAQALRQVHEWLRSALPISASAWHDNILRVRLCGALAAVRAGAARLVEQSGARIVEQDAAQAYWNGLRDQQDAFFTSGRAPESGATLWRLSVPATHSPLDLPGNTLLEWNGAQRWLFSSAPAAQLQELAARAGGHASVFRAAQRGAEFLAPLSPALERIHRALKQSFDPAGIFNRGRLYPWL
ncbi:glycolate oxidase FAD binding subunit [Burkholderiales bacterium]|nr:glycolate oxidase FAD binding subunit [Burkholderiales bacterium]